MNMLFTEIKRLFKNPGFMAIYFLLLFGFVFLAATLDLEAELDYKSLIGVIDEENNEKSREFIESLNQGSAIKALNINLENAESAEADKLILQGKYSAILTIPKGFFEKLPDLKLKYKILENDRISGALLDLIAQGFIEDTIKKTLEKRLVEEFGNEGLADSLKDYDALRDSDDFKLEVIETAYGERKGVFGKIDKREIASASSFLGFAAGISALFISISLKLGRLKNYKLMRCMRIRAGSLNRYLFTKKALDYFFVSLPLVISSLIIMNRIHFSSESIFYYCVMAILVEILIYEVLELIDSALKEEYSMYLMLVTALIFTLIGEAFFSLDLLPDIFIRLSAMTPFGVLKSAFFDAVDMNLIYGNALILLVFSSCLIVTNRILILRKIYKK